MLSLCRNVSLKAINFSADIPLRAAAASLSAVLVGRPAAAAPTSKPAIAKGAEAGPSIGNVGNRQCRVASFADH